MWSLMPRGITSSSAIPPWAESGSSTLCDVCRQCDGDFPKSALSRRALIAGGLAAGTAGVLGIATQASGATQANGALLSAAVTVAPGLDILPRDAWGADLAPKGPMGVEDVRFLLVHHTSSPNNYRGTQRDLIRIAYAFHTGPAKRWNDVAYNFFIGQDGTVWEGRAGSLDGPVEASASGGSQGFAQLVCLLGDFTDFTPPAAMQDSLVHLLAHLAHRYDLSTWKDARAQFNSRGSDRWKAGSFIETPTISGHRDMTYTACPGEAAYRLLPEWRRRVHPLVQAARKQPGLQRAERLSLEAP